MGEQKPVAAMWDNDGVTEWSDDAASFEYYTKQYGVKMTYLFTADQLKAEREKAIREIAELFTFNTKARILALLSTDESKE